MKRGLLLALLWLVPADAAVQSAEDSIARERIVALASHVSEISKRVEQRFEQAEHAVTLANTSLEKRLDSINEFRGQLRDQQSLFITKAEVDQRFAALIERVNTLQARVDKAEGQVSGVGGLWGYMVGAVGALAVVFSILRRNGTRSA